MRTDPQAGIPASTIGSDNSRDEMFEQDLWRRKRQGATAPKDRSSRMEIAG
jgi:hypothetical protein